MGMDFFGFGGEKEKKWEGQGPGPLWRVEEKIIIISGFSFGAGSMHGTSETHSCTIQFIYLIFVYFNSRMYFFFLILYNHFLNYLYHISYNHFFISLSLSLCI